MSLPEFITTYIHAKWAMSQWKDEENKLRRLAVPRLVGESKERGVQTINLPDGYVAKVKQTLNYNVKNDQGQVIYLQSIMPPDMFANLFKMRWDISVSGYEALTPQQKLVIDYALEIKPGMPELEIIAPPKGNVI